MPRMITNGSLFVSLDDIRVIRMYFKEAYDDIGGNGKKAKGHRRCSKET
jgi:hypothetical protein